MEDSVNLRLELFKEVSRVLPVYADSGTTLKDIFKMKVVASNALLVLLLDIEKFMNDLSDERGDKKIMARARERSRKIKDWSEESW